MLEKIKSLFKKNNETQELTASELKRREKLNAEINHPDDNFINDEFMDEDEMRRLNEKSTKKGNFRNGYYAFGFLFAAVIIIYALVNIFKDSKFDLRIMVQDDGFITESEIAQLEELVKPYVEDRNEDGEVKIEVISIGMPMDRTDANEALYQSAIDDMSKELVPHYVSIVFGRENFITEVNEIRPIKEQVLLNEIKEVEEDSTLNEYYIAVRETVQEADKYSPVGIDIFNKITE